jgi:hypothetical protein
MDDLEIRYFGETREQMHARHEREAILDKTRRGFNDIYPALWTCSRCKYSYWSYGEEQDPAGDHCVDGNWLADHRAISVL